MKRRMTLSEWEQRAAVTALAFALASDELFVDEDGDEIPEQIAAAEHLRWRLAIGLGL